MRTFAQLLTIYTRRIGISDSELARALGVRRETVFRWKEGLVERPRNREDVLRCADKLRLTPVERDELLLAAGFAPETPIVPAGPNGETAPSPVSVPTDTLQPPSELDIPRPAVGQQAAAAITEDGPPLPPAEIAEPVPQRRHRRIYPVVLGLVALVVVSVAALIMLVRPASREYPVASPDETLVVVGRIPWEQAGPPSGRTAQPEDDPQGLLIAAMDREIQASRLERVRVVAWPDVLPDAASAESARRISGAGFVVGGIPDSGRLTLMIVGMPPPGADSLPLEALSALPRTATLTLDPTARADIQALALLVLSRLQADDPARARAALVQAQTRQPTQPDALSAVLSETGWLDLASRPPSKAEAVSLFTRAIEATDTTDARLGRGLAYVRLGDPRWKADIEQAALHAPDDAGMQLVLCWGLALGGEHDLALPRCDAAAKAYPDRVHEPRAIALAKQGRLPEAAAALRSLEKWLEGQPEALKSRYGNSRSEWAAALESGRDPFDSTVIERVRNE